MPSIEGQALQSRSRPFLPTGAPPGMLVEAVSSGPLMLGLTWKVEGHYLGCCPVPPCHQVRLRSLGLRHAEDSRQDTSGLGVLAGVRGEPERGTGTGDED